MPEIFYLDHPTLDYPNCTTPGWYWLHTNSLHGPFQTKAQATLDLNLWTTEVMFEVAE